MRWIDHWLGRPICFVLTVIRKSYNLLPFPQKSSPQKVKRILFVKLAEQGATVLADASIRRAAEMVGKENVYFLVFRQNRFILDVMNIIPQENVLTIPDNNFISILFGTIGVLHRIRKLRIDAAVDFEFFARSSAILTWLSGAGIRVGFHTFFDESPYRGDLMTHRLNYNPHLHASQMFEVMVDAINLPAKEMPRLNMDLPKMRAVESKFTASEVELKEFKAILEKEAGTSNYSPLILLNVNASDMLPLRRWPLERYVELAQKLLEKSPAVHIAFTGAPDETENSQKLVRAVATLTDVKVVTLFGPETPLLFGANTPRCRNLWKNIPCSPCVSAYNNRRSVCDDNICMQRISVDEVFDLLCEKCKL